MATYTCYGFTLTDGRVISDVPLDGIRPSWGISQPGDFGSPTLRLAGLDPLRRDEALAATVPWRCGIVLDRDGEAVWAGIITARRYTASSGAYALTVTGILGYWQSRLIATAMSWDTVEQFQVVRDLIAAGGAPTVPIVVDAPDSGVKRSRNLAAADLNAVLDEITQISDNIGGFEFVVESAWAGVTAGTQQVVHTLRLRHPILSSGRSGVLPVTVEYPGNIRDYSWDEDGSSFATDMWGSSQTDEGVDLVRSASNPALLALGYPRVMRSRTWSNISDAGTLDDHILQALAEAASYTATPTLTVPDSGDTAVGAWAVGDDVRVRITDAARWPTSDVGPGLDRVMRLATATLDPDAGTLEWTLTDRLSTETDQ